MRTVTILLLFGAIFCCTEPEIQPAKQKATEQVKAPPEEQPFEVPAEGAAKPSAKKHAYRFEGKRDPFVAPILVPPGPDGPTQKHPVLSYQLVGVITQAKKSTAMIRSPEGEAYALRIGSPLGNKGGKVTKITSKQIIVTEWRPGAAGSERIDISLELPKDNSLLQQPFVVP